MSNRSPEVLVVGAGPAGLVAAAELARHGVSVRIIDKLEAPTDQSRAIAVQSRSLDMLARMGTVDQLIDTGVKAGCMNLLSGRTPLFRVPLDGIDAAYPFSLNTPQTETERVLTAHLNSLGITVERGIELTGLSQDDGNVHLTLKHIDGAAEQFSTRFVVAADGAHSTVRHLVGGKFEGTFVGERFLLGDVDTEHDLDPESMYTFFSPGGPVLVMPMRDGRTRVMAQVHDAPGVALNMHPTLEQLQQVVDQRIGGIRLLRGHWLTSFELHHAQVPQYRWGRAFLIGDAAHIHSPAGGQGMNTGMQDAFNLAWKLAAVLNEQAGESLLDSYHAERHPVAEKMIAFTERLSKAGTLSGGPEHIRNALLKGLSHIGPVGHAMATTTAQLTVNYQGSPVIGGSLRGAKVAAGQHFPFIADDDLHQRLTGSWGVEHTVLTIAGDHRAPAPRHHGRQVLVAADDTPVDGYDTVIADPNSVVAQRLGLRAGGRVVVRPDSYIGAIGTLDDDAVDAYFTLIAK